MHDAHRPVDSQSTCIVLWLNISRCMGMSKSERENFNAPSLLHTGTIWQHL